MEIKFFLASSIEEFEFDRLVIGDYFNQLNNIFLSRGVFCRLIKCEHYEKSPFNKDGKQNELDDDIRNSDIVFFLFYKKVGDYTKHEFEIALDAYKKQNKPKIVTYFKHVEDVDEISGDVRAFMDNLGNKLQHYYRTYNHPDTLKVEAVTQILQLVSKDLNLTISDGSIMLDDQKIADIKNVPILKGNAALKELIDKKDELSKRQKERRSDFLSDSDNEEKRRALLRVSEELDEVSKRLTEVENATFELMRTIATMTADGENGSEIMRKAISAYDRGDYDAAIAILEDEECQNELERAELLKEAGERGIIGRISRIQLWIDAVEAQGQVKERWEDIKSKYDEIYDIVVKDELSCDYLRKYVNFFLVHHDPVRPAKAAGRLSWYYSNPDVSVEDGKRAEINNFLGAVYRAAGDFDNAMRVFSDIKKIYERLVKEHPENQKYEESVACNHIDLGAVYMKKGMWKEAAEEYDAAKKIYERLAENNPENYEYEAAIAAIYNSFALLFETEPQPQEAEKAYLAARNIYERIVDREPSFNEPLALLYNNLGNFYAKIGKLLDAKRELDKANRIFTDFVKQDPYRYEPDMALNRCHLGYVYDKMGNFRCAERELEAAKKIYQRFAALNPNKYEPELMNVHCNLADLYTGMERYLKTKEELYEATQLGAELIKRDIEKYGAKVAENYVYLGGCCARLYSHQRDRQNYGEAINAYLEAIKICERLVDINPYQYEEKLANYHCTLANFHKNNGKYDKSNEEYEKGLAIFAKLAAKDPDKYKPLEAKGLLFQGANYKERGIRDRRISDINQSEELLRRALEIFDEYEQKEPGKYGEDIRYAKSLLAQK
jgi:tetratricopeptide (TPR) repeat protein